MTPDFDFEDLTYLRGIPDSVKGRGMFGLEDVVNILVVALISDGHVLLEGNPGLGKTALVRALSGSLGLGAKAVGRIQFTPDLMPSDITGTLMPVDAPGGGTRLEFREGPIFCRLLLADEINRATPKTQAAMLEAMAEFQVTVLGTTHDLRKPVEDLRSSRPDPVRPPFMVMATQNPIDQDGTYDLPEAQLDRFLFKVRMAMPGSDTILGIIAKELQAIGPTVADSSKGAGDLTGKEGAAIARIAKARRALSGLSLPPAVAAHIVNIVQASNGNFDEVRGVSPLRLQALRAHVGDRVSYPLGPRAAIALARGALGWAAVALADPNEPQAVSSWATQGLGMVLIPALRHRVRINLQQRDLESAQLEERAKEEWLAELARAAAPDSRIASEAADYHRRFSTAFDASGAAARL